LKQDQDEAKKSAQEVGDPKTYNERYDKTLADIKNLQKLREGKSNERGDFRQQLGRNTADQKDYMRVLEAEIK
jgi:hypothetical protein